MNQSKPNEENSLRLVVDSSVREEIIDQLKSRGEIPEIRDIWPFQFKVSEKLGGYIKTFQEFYELIKKKEVFEKAKVLKNKFLRPLLILEEGNNKSKLDRNVFLEAWSKLFVQFDIPIILSRSAKDTAKLLLTILRRERSDKIARITTRVTKAPTSLPELQKYIIRGMPGINEDLAGRLLFKFKTIERLVAAKPEDYMEVKGIGKKLAEKLHTVFTFLYKSKSS